MKGTRLVVLCALTLLLAHPVAASAGVQATFYLSPSGSDSNNGSLSSPFKTLEKARSEVRKINANMTGDIIVNLKEGIYPLTSTFALGPDDSGSNNFNVIYQALSPKTAILSGGVQATGWSLHDSGKNIYRSYVGPQETRQLYVNGRRATRARSTVSGYYMPGFTKTGTGYVTTNTNMQYWANQQDIEIVGFDRWKSFRCGVAGISGGQITMKQPCWNNTQLHQGFQMQLPVWVENAYELLDEEGEWYWSRPDGYLYYKPRSGENLATATAMIPRLQTLVSAIGTPDRSVHNIQIKGIVFAYAGWLEPNGNDGFCPLQADSRITGTHATMPWDLTKTPAHVDFVYAKSIRLERNVFTHLGATAVAFGCGSQGNAIVGNLFRDISGSGIRVGEFDGGYSVPGDARLLVKDNAVDSNTLTEVAAEYHSGVGILVGYTEHTEVTHNEIYNTPYTGISVGWGWTDQVTTLRDNKVEFNHIYDIMKLLNDGGGIYLLSRQDGTEIFENYIHDVRRGLHPDFWLENRGIYLDNGTSFVTVEHNVLQNIPGEVIYVQHIGLPAHDNILINNSTQDESVKKNAGPAFSLWQWAPQFTPPYHIAADGYGDLGARFLDLNADGKVDMAWHRYVNGSLQRGAALSTPDGWTWAWDFTPPYHLVAEGIGDLGARFVDVNGDGLPDLVYHRWFNGNVMQGAYLNTRYGWQWAPQFTPPYHIAADGYGDLGARFLDLNADGKVDMVWHRYVNGSLQRGAVLSTGYGWTWAWDFTPPYHLVAEGIGDLGARFVDVNGDGLPDLLYHRYYGGNVMKGAYLNTRYGWQWAPQFTPPYAITSDGLGDLGVRFLDVNGDGRVDIVYHRVAGSDVQKGAYVNTGSGWQWATEHAPPYPTMVDGKGDLGVAFIDLNGDGKLDMVYHRYNNGAVEKGAYLNVPGLVSHTGANWQWSPEYTPPYHLYADGIGDMGARFADVNGDGLPDLVYHRWFNGNVMQGAYLGTR